MTLEAETAAQLTRIEGTVNLLRQMLESVIPVVERHTVEISALQLNTQKLDLEAKARDEKAVALAVALKEAKETAEATASAEAAKEVARDGKSWSPIQRLVLVAGTVSTAIAIWQSIKPGG